MRIFANYILIISALFITSCGGNDFHYDKDKKAIVSNHESFQYITVDISNKKNDTLAYNCIWNIKDLQEGAKVIPLQEWSSYMYTRDTDCLKAFYKPNTTVTITNHSNGDAGPFSMTFLIDSNKNITEVKKDF